MARRRRGTQEELGEWGGQRGHRSQNRKAAPRTAVSLSTELQASEGGGTQARQQAQPGGQSWLLRQGHCLGRPANVSERFLALGFSTEIMSPFPQLAEEESSTHLQFHHGVLKKKTR